jgi:beta-1,4-mannooligosaccharide/beta-1,4-mannosyl-N-acetylglucosamine phosphorylase
MHGLFQRYQGNPIITASDLPYPGSAVFNPGAVLVGDETLLLLRIEDMRGISHLTVARSSDGIGGWRIEPEPLLAPNGDAPYDALGVEDPRITHLEEDGRWAIAYTAYSEYGPAVALATTEDFKSVNRLGLVLSPNNKDAALFPRRFNGRYVMLHRPVFMETEHIWVAHSPDLRHWGEPTCILTERFPGWWDGTRVGAGAPPIETPDGWLLIYHGVKQAATGPIYRLGVAISNLDFPDHVIYRTEGWSLAPHESYERYGDVPNVVFTCGAVVKGDEVWVYYGAADTCVCLATAKLADLVECAKDICYK